MYNKNFVLTMDVGQTVIAKVPNPNAGIAYFTTAIEVATVDFVRIQPADCIIIIQANPCRVRNVLGTPAPKVFSWDCPCNKLCRAE